jgi:peptidoglycan/xylan/chitin deacetylase (PgdA/CDA1 family)
MKSILFKLLYALGATRLTAWYYRRRVTILCYHGVTRCSDRRRDDPQGFDVRDRRFAAQLNYLESRCHILSLADYLAARREGRRLPDYSVSMTFDDGHRNFLTAAGVDMAARRIQATFFIISDCIRVASDEDVSVEWSPRDDKVFLSWSDVDRLRRTLGFEIGSHTCSHAELTLLTAREVQREMEQSRSEIVGRLGVDILPFAYPKGKYSEGIVAKARALGYNCALTTDGGGNDSGTDLFKLRRTLIGDDDDEPAFAARVSGLAHLLSQAQERLRFNGHSERRMGAHQKEY